EEVEKVFNNEFFKERRRKFGIRDPKKIYDSLQKWYEANKRGLKKYVMYDVYKGVLKEVGKS
ncbi:TPA: hypothetical protein DCQ85_01395, partial [Candidatus Magasanikbacteria bacterium]|nr:hypothetical protein [Candidatus Magasanikbacteria bacterium]